MEQFEHIIIWESTLRQSLYFVGFSDDDIKRYDMLNPEHLEHLSRVLEDALFLGFDIKEAQRNYNLLKGYGEVCCREASGFDKGEKQFEVCYNNFTVRSINENS